MRKILSIGIAITIINVMSLITCLNKYDSEIEALKDYPGMNDKGGKQPKYLYFTMTEDGKKEIAYFSKILYRFMATMGARPYFVNLRDENLLGILPKDTDVDIDVILDRFRGIVSKIEITTKMRK